MEMVRSAPIVSDETNALDVIVTLRGEHSHMVLVVDEHGSFEGIVTEGDILKTIAGEIGGTRAPNLPSSSASMDRY